jgi:hypothetical protein
LVKATQVGKARSTDLAAVWSLTAITNKVNTHLTLGSLNCRISFARRYSISFGEQEEVVDKSFHIFLHSGSRRRTDFVVLNLDRSGRHLVQTLVNDSKRLAELLHPTQVAIITVTINSNGDVEFDLVICIIGLGFAYIPWHTGTSKHNSSKAHVQSVRSTYHPNTLRSGFPDPVISKQLFCFINSVAKLSRPLVNIIEKAERNILGDTTRANIRSVEASTGNPFIKLLLTSNPFSSDNIQLNIP